VHGWTAEQFLTTLAAADVRLLLDVRQRRGVRGSEYAWANARRLETALENAGVDYQHRRELAPTTELRALQYAEDARLGEGKRSRTVLAPAYVARFEREILADVDLGRILRAMPGDGATALLCVERDARACHRSLVALRLADRCDVVVRHLTPA
jgi:uncharacterized protein (DUF488 family)